MGRRGGRQSTKKTSARGQRAPARAARPGRPAKTKVCVFCASHSDWVDYKDVNTLRRLLSDRGKIKARRATGTCRQHQRDVSIAIKTARELALLPYVLSPAVADKPRRGGGRPDSRPPGNGRPDSASGGANMPTEGPAEHADNGAPPDDDQVPSKPELSVGDDTDAA